MGKYQEESRWLLKFVGGIENIIEVTHCVTRMRFVLKDFDKAIIDGIENLESVIGTFTGAGQFQVIIGSDIDNFFADFMNVAGIKAVDNEVQQEEVTGSNQKEMTLLERIEEKFEDFFSPVR